MAAAAAAAAASWPGTSWAHSPRPTPSPQPPPPLAGIGSCEYASDTLSRVFFLFFFFLRPRGDGGSGLNV